MRSKALEQRAGREEQVGTLHRASPVNMMTCRELWEIRWDQLHLAHSASLQVYASVCACARMCRPARAQTTGLASVAVLEEP